MLHIVIYTHMITFMGIGNMLYPLDPGRGRWKMAPMCFHCLPLKNDDFPWLPWLCEITLDSWD